MEMTRNDDGTWDLFAADGRALRVIGSGDPDGIASVHLTRWADPADWEEFDPQEDGGAEDAP